MSILNVETYVPGGSDKFFFDTNIWFILYEPIGQFREAEQKAYSTFLDKILDDCCEIYISSLVLSEFINAALRFDFAQWKKELRKDYADYKQDYRPTDRCVATLARLNSTVKRNILKISKRLGDGFEKFDLEPWYRDCSPVSDFNDTYYIGLAKKHGLMLVSNDKDCFSANGVSVLTCTT